MSKEPEFGEFTYGAIGIEKRFSGYSTKLIIGKYCSISNNVQVFLGGRHEWKWFTTWPFGLELDEIKDNPYSGKVPDGFFAEKGDVIIGNDVWISDGVTIMPGVKISDGAVVAANSHVVSNVGPYEIWGGNPAKLIKKRFSDEIIAGLIDLKWWDYPVESIKKIVPVLQSEPSIEKISKIKDILKQTEKGNI